MPTDMQGTPFVFAAWLTGNRGGVPVGRVIDRDPFEADPSYGMEVSEVPLPGAPDLRPGSVILSDRASLCVVLGQEGFSVAAGSWSIGFAASEEEALSLVGSSVCPGEWPDPRVRKPSEEELYMAGAVDMEGEGARPF